MPYFVPHIETYSAPNHEPPTSMSPAAMFLSSFSPVSTSSSLSQSGTIEGEVICGYTLREIIGYGASSTIRRAHDDTSVVAVKIIETSKYKNRLSLLEREAAIWKAMNHENLLPLFDTYRSPSAHYFVTILCPEGSVYDLLYSHAKGLSPDDTHRVFSQIVSGLQYMHNDVGYVHRDIKLENVLLDEMGVCRIADFGMSVRIGEIESESGSEDEGKSGMKLGRNATLPTSACRPNVMLHHRVSSHASRPPRRRSPSSKKSKFQPGSLPYAAPELLNGHALVPAVPHPSQDIWALGVLLYALVTGKLPFVDQFEPRLRLKILSGKYPPPTEDSPELDLELSHMKTVTALLESTILVSAEKRWSIDQVHEECSAWGIESHVTSASSSTSVSRRESEQPADPFEVERPSLMTARRRSASRMERSKSRAPGTPTSLVSRTSDRSRSRVDGDRAQRSRSRAYNEGLPREVTVQSHVPPSLDIFEQEPTHTAAITIPKSSHHSTPLDLEEYDIMAAGPIESHVSRGRRPTRELHIQRSPSPSAMPSTPPRCCFSWLPPVRGYP